MAGESLPALITELLTCRSREKKYRDRKAVLEARIPEIMQEQGLTNIKLDSGPSLSLRPNDPKVKAWQRRDVDDEQFFAALRNAGAGHLVKNATTVNNTSLRAWIKDQIKNAVPLPPEVEHSVSPGFSLSAKGFEDNE